MNILFILAMMNEKHTRERKLKKKCRVTVSATIKTPPPGFMENGKNKTCIC